MLFLIRKLGMKKTICLALILMAMICIIARGLISSANEIVGRGNNKSVEQIVSEINQRQHKLVVLKVSLTTTAFYEEKMKLSSDVGCGVVHTNDIDVIVNLANAEVITQEVESTANGTQKNQKRVVVVLPEPEIDFSTVGINPGNVELKVAIGSGSERYDYVRDMTLKKVEERVKDTIKKMNEGSNSFIPEAKSQAFTVLTNLYADFGCSNVTIEWKKASVLDAR